MKNIKAVIFDLDDTLYLEHDYILSGFKCVANYLSTVNGLVSNEIYKRLSVLFLENKLEVFNRYLNENNLLDKDIFQNCIDIYREHYPDIKLLPLAYYILKWLKNNNYKIGILTDGRPEGQWNKIKALDIEKLCDEIIVTDELGGPEYRKPNELPYNKMLKHLCVTPEQAIYVGDNPAKDFLAANKLGIVTFMIQNEKGLYQTIGYPKEYYAKYIISDLIQIKYYLESDLEERNE
jgi:putative hydrolase of the HAD superfamily